jgi:ADP-ribosylglycohydrolase
MDAATVPSPPSMRERYAGLLYGALASDALALGAHWIYDQAEIARRFGRVTELQAATKESYHPGRERGALTHYGDQMLILLESLEASGGNFVMEDFARRWRQFWSDSTSYRDHATKETLAHLEEGLGLTRAGSDSTELGGAARIAPILAALRNEDQPTPIAVDTAEFLARTVFILMRGVSVSSALQMAVALPFRALPAEHYLRQAEKTLHLPTAEAVVELGQSCPIEKALPAVFAILLRHHDDFETALIENVMAGGDSAARGLVLGTILGAAFGRRAIPDRWIESLRARRHVEAFLKTVGLGGTD